MDYPKSVPNVGLVNGKFVDEDQLSGKAGSLITSQWANAITDEILTLILAAKIVPDEAKNSQLLEAIRVLVTDSLSGQATESAMGVAKIATQNQTNSGTDDTAFVTPKKLSNALSVLVIQATEALRGIAKVATQVQTNAGTDDATFVTPKKLRAGFAIQLAANGYIAFPTWMGGLIVQWGLSPAISESSSAVTLPLTYPTSQLAAYATVNSSGVTVQGNYSAYAFPTSTSVITVCTDTNVSSGATGQTVRWLSLGY